MPFNHATTNARALSLGRIRRDRQDVVGVSLSVLHLLLEPPALHHVSEYERHVCDLARRIAGRRGTVVNRLFCVVLGDQHRMVRQPDDDAVS